MTLRGAGSGSTFIDGSSSGTAVVIGSSSASLAVAISSLTVQHGVAANGGGIMSVPGTGFTNTVVVTKSTIADNEAIGAYGQDAFGGGIYAAVGSTIRVRISTIRDNSADGGTCVLAVSGGGIYSAGTLSIDRSTLSGNEATWANFCGSGSPGSGGAIDSSGPLTVTSSTISGNVAKGEAAVGAVCIGISCKGLAGGEGLGGALVGDSTVKVINSTITANVAQGGGGSPVTAFCHATFCYGGDGGVASGGAIVARSTETVINSTIAGNQALGGPGGYGRNGSGKRGTDSAGGIDLSGGSVDLTNAILATNTATTGPDCDGRVTSGGHNLLGNDGSCAGFTGSGDLVNVDPLLGPLQDNGGPTSTMALGTGSPAIDAADDSVCAGPAVKGVDQRGVPRPGGSHCDIGAFEVQAS